MNIFNGLILIAIKKYMENPYMHNNETINNFARF